MLSRPFAPRVALVLLLFAAAPVRAADSPLTLAAAQQLAIQRSQQLSGEAAAARASRALAVAAAQLPDPVLTAGIDNLPVNGPDRLRLGADFMTMRKVGISLELVRPEKRHWRAAALERDAERLDALREASQAGLARDTALAWLDRYYLERQCALSDTLAEQLHQEISAIEAAYAGGRASQVDVIAARQALLAQQDRSDELKRRLATARIQLARWTGADPAQPLAVVPALRRAPLSGPDAERLAAQHPALLAGERQVAAAQAEASLAQASRKADWTAEVMLQQRGAGNSNMVSFALSIPLQWDKAKRQDQELAARRAAVEQASAQRGEALRSLSSETQAQLADWDAGQLRLARVREQMLPLAVQRTKAALAAYRGGKGSLADVLSARRNETDAQLQAVQLEADIARVWAQLNYLLPQPLALGSMAGERR